MDIDIQCASLEIVSVGILCIVNVLELISSAGVDPELNVQGLAVPLPGVVCMFIRAVTTGTVTRCQRSSPGLNY